MKKRLFISLIMSLVLVMSSVTTVLANEASYVLTDEEIEELYARFEELNVETNKREGLIEKIERGELLDCAKEEYIGIAPVYTSKISDGSVEVRYVYPDGSVRVQTVTYVQPDSNPNSRAVTGGTWYSSTGYRSVTEALVQASDLYVTLCFYADFEFVQGEYGKIKAVYKPGAKTYFSDYTDLQVNIYREQSVEIGTQNLPAMACCSAQVTYAAELYSTQYRLYLYVYSYDYSSEFERGA